MRVGICGLLLFGPLGGSGTEPSVQALQPEDEAWLQVTEQVLAEHDPNPILKEIAQSAVSALTGSSRRSAHTLPSARPRVRITSRKKRRMQDPEMVRLTHSTTPPSEAAHAASFLERSASTQLTMAEGGKRKRATLTINPLHEPMGCEEDKDSNIELIQLSEAPLPLHCVNPAHCVANLEELNCVYTKENCTCVYRCPCAWYTEPSNNSSGLWCGCEEKYQCLCELGTGSCVYGPPEDAFLVFPGMMDPNPGWIEVQGSEEGLDFSKSKSFTIEAWVNNSGTGGTIFAKYNDNVRGQVVLNVDSNGFVIFKRLADQVELMSTKRLPKGEFMHVAAVFNGHDHTRTIYMNGKPAGTDVQEGNVDPDKKTPVLIGAMMCENKPCNYFTGILDDVRVWMLARKQESIKGMSSYRIKGLMPKLKGYWRLDEGPNSKKEVPDYSGHALKGALMGGLSWYLDPKLFGEEQGFVRAKPLLPPLGIKGLSEGKTETQNAYPIGEGLTWQDGKAKQRGSVMEKVNQGFSATKVAVAARSH